MTTLCLVCHNPFSPYNFTQKYCNKSCRRIGNNNDPNRRYDKINREKVVKFLGGKCINCGYKKDIRALQLDHIKGDGASEIRRLSNGKDARGAHGRRNYASRYYVKHLNEVSGVLQVLCANCNAIKKDENQEWPSKQ